MVGGAGSENVIQIYGKKSRRMCGDATYGYLYRHGESEKIPNINNKRESVKSQGRAAGICRRAPPVYQLFMNFPRCDLVHRTIER